MADHREKRANEIRPKSRPPRAAGKYTAPLPGFGQRHREGPALIILQDVVSGDGAACVAGSVLEGRMNTHEVLDDELNTDVLKIVIGGRIAGVVAHGKIEGVPWGLDVGIIVDQ